MRRKQIAIPFSGTLNLRANGATPTRFSIVAYTGGKLHVDGFDLPVVVDLEGLEASGEIPIAIQHNTSSEMLLGQTDTIENDRRQLVLAGPITADPADSPSVRRILKMAAKGHKWQASIGAKVQTKVRVEAGQKRVINGQTLTGPFWHATRSILRETSVLGMGADKDTRVVLAQKKGTGQMNRFKKWLKKIGFEYDELDDTVRANLREQFDLIQANADTGTGDESQDDDEADDEAIDDIDAESELDLEAEEGDTESDEDTESDDELDDDEAPPRGRDRVNANARTNRRRTDARANSRRNATPPVDLTAHNQAAATNYRRIQQIQARFGTDQALCASAINRNWSVNRTELEFRRRQERRNVPFGHRSSGGGQNMLQALQGAMIMRAGGRIDFEDYGGMMGLALRLPRWLRAGINEDARQQTMEQAYQFRDMSMVDLCRAALSIDQVECPLSRQEMIQAAVSGGTLADIFTTNINAVLVQKLLEAGDSTLGWTQEADAPNFQTMDRTRLTKGPNLTRHARGGEADHQKRGAETESYKIARYSARFAVDEMDIIDDHFQALADIPNEMAMACSRLRPDLVYAILLANPTLTATGRALFNTTDGNLVSSGGGLSMAAIKTAIAAMWSFTENGANLNIMPTHILVPPLKKFDADEFVNSTSTIITGTTDTVRGNNNSLADMQLKVVTDGRLHNGVTDPATDTVYSGSDTTWRLVSSQSKTIEVAYLRGAGRAPQVRQYQLTQGKWGVGWDVNMDIGAKAMGWRGMFESRA